MMTEQAEPIHPLAAMGIQLQAQAANAIVRRDFDNLLASLSGTTVTFSGTFEGSAGIDALLGAAPPLRDLTFTPDEAERPECPECHELADDLRFEGAQLETSTVCEDGMDMQTLQSKSVKVVQFLPCGHRFDGVTGDLIEES